MQLNTLIIDNFYAEPDAVRSFALAQEFSKKGYNPGVRTRPFLSEDVKAAIQHWMAPVGKITYWHEEEDSPSGAFQVTTALDRSWIHSDYNNTWAGVCYLTPNAPISSGTGIYKHKTSGEWTRTTTDHEPYDYTKWDLVDRIGNKYNRLLIYNSKLFHTALDYFGDNVHNARLFQTFFFDT